MSTLVGNSEIYFMSFRHLLFILFLLCTIWLKLSITSILGISYSFPNCFLNLLIISILWLLTFPFQINVFFTIYFSQNILNTKVWYMCQILHTKLFLLLALFFALCLRFFDFLSFFCYVNSGWFPVIFLIGSSDYSH